MGRIVVEIMPKDEILDPQGKAIANALKRLGIQGFVDARQGKLFELFVDGAVTSDHLAKARQATEKLLANTVIEKVVNVYEATDQRNGSDKLNSSIRQSAQRIASDFGSHEDDLVKIIGASGASY
ncbi:MAG: phosphoribosylformylglycinamidine synthase subunit PurS [Candidatus Ancillula trichonymphae]|jgi:phosphoribosylformylglycinamidine synthase|nr:phosphoribosylformylglycinamidine synthase subunit PurS [Candidatus Ancillula trichonymphae]